MAVPVDNRSYMKRATDKGNLKNIGAAPAKLKGTNKDNPTIEKLGGYETTNLGRSRTAFGQSDDTGPAKKISSKIAPAPQAKPKPKPKAVSPDPTNAPKQTLLQKQDKLASRIRAGGQSKPKEPPSPAKPAAKPADKPAAKPVDKPASKPAAKPAEPSKAKTPKPKSTTPKLAPRPKQKPVNVATRPVKALRTDQELDVNPKRQKAAPEKDDGYKFYGKEGTGLGDFSRKFGFKYATPEQFEKDFGMDDGEQAGGRPGKGKMKTQGLNRSKRTGFSGRGTGAALRGF